MARVAFLFPGQGAQSVGMAQELCGRLSAAQDLFAQASGVLGYDLLDVCANGPAERLNSTAVSQPAIFVASLAALESLRHSDSGAVAACEAAAGLSLGEFTALTFAEALTFADGLRLVKRRGEAMQEASDRLPGAMLSIIGPDQTRVEDMVGQARQADVLRVANYLAPANYVVSGDRVACNRLATLAETSGARVVRLAVAGAFHTALMQPAHDAMAEVFARVPIGPTRIPVWSNVTARPHGGPDEVRGLLARQMVEPVCWEETMRGLLAEGFDRFYEVGPGRVLAGLLKRVQRRVDVQNVAA
jgi:[acyl-carrier-protein] S-malonyltransferase